MAWIESHQAVATHPKTKKLARILQISIPEVVGHLHMLWWWALDYAPDGSLERYDAADIADAVMWEGDPQEFVDAATAAGYIDRDESGYSLHDWYERAGRLVEKRIADAARKQAARRSRSTPVERDVPPPVEEPAPEPVSSLHALPVPPSVQRTSSGRRA